MKQDEISKNLKDINQWLRILYMVLFALALYLSNIVLFVVALVQAVFSIITGSPNPNLKQLGDSLSTYIHQLASFLSYASEVKPFPFSDWPKAEVMSEPAENLSVVEESSTVEQSPSAHESASESTSETGSENATTIVEDVDVTPETPDASGDSDKTSSDTDESTKPS